MAPRHRGGGVRHMPVMRGAAAGLVAGLPVGVLLSYQGMLADRGAGVLPAWLLYLGYVLAVGAALGLAVGIRPRGLAAAASGGLLLGLLGWLVWSLTLEPLLSGLAPTWSVADAGLAYRHLVGDLLHGGLTGVLLYAVNPSSAAGSEPPTPIGQQRVVIVGGGFAGVAAAQRFERLAVRAGSPDVTLISATNFLLFTPMLAEAASGALEPAHISAPLRAAAGRTRFRQGTVVDVDTTHRTVHLAVDDAIQDIAYDQLVLAVGSVPSFLGIAGVAEHAFTLKNLRDATRLRNHVLALLERCDRMEAGEERTRMLTIVVAGGGFAGTEIVAELFDLVHGVSHFYPAISQMQPRFVLVHSRERILPELSPELGEYARQRLRARGIDFRLGVRVTGVSADEVQLGNGECIGASTFVWTAGNRPDPLVARLGGSHARSGALVTDPALRVDGLERVWAVGDCAQIPDGDGAPYPPTAQHALRQGKVVADNITAVLADRAPSPFRFRTIGVLVALGHRTAAAEIRGRRFSGLVAWVLWRGIYLAKLPGAEKRVRVFSDWLLDLAFPRDIVMTEPDDVPTGRAATPAEPS